MNSVKEILTAFEEGVIVHERVPTKKQVHVITEFIDKVKVGLGDLHPFCRYRIEDRDSNFALVVGKVSLETDTPDVPWVEFWFGVRETIEIRNSDGDGKAIGDVDMLRNTILKYLSLARSAKSGKQRQQEPRYPLAKLGKDESTVYGIVEQLNGIIWPDDPTGELSLRFHVVPGSTWEVTWCGHTVLDSEQPPEPNNIGLSDAYPTYNSQFDHWYTETIKEMEQAVALQDKFITKIKERYAQPNS